MRPTFHLLGPAALAALLLAGCDLFATREPEDPLGESGTWEQPDTPEQVVENVRAAIAELNAPNYRRSLADDLVFHPAATAQAQHPIWATWSRPEEERYFSALAAAARRTPAPQLQLLDQTLSVDQLGRYVFDANYVLTIDHTRPAVPAEVQGRLVWTLAQGTDGLWRVQEWTDQQVGTAPSWSDLKAEFY